MNFNLKEYYKKAWSGIECGDKSIIPYIKEFSHVILWGASFQGKAIGNRLIENGVKIDCYWDLRWDTLQKVNDIKVIAPFQSEEKEQTLIIVCIGNRVIQDNLVNELRQHGFTNVVFGDYLYMGLICPFNQKTGIKAKRCSKTMECRQVYCRRIEGILGAQYATASNPLFLPSITLVINQRCSLRCKYCTSYMNEYPQGERVDFSLERICDDIDKFMGAVDVVGTITVMGGEPFMHKDISKIIDHLCKWDNFGLISIATSGTWPIKEEQLIGLHDDRVNISFSNYTESITENQKKLFYDNIEMVKTSGVCYTVGVFSPEWIVPCNLKKKNLTDEQITNNKSVCTHWHQIKNGKVHPCDYANSLYSLHVADYPTDYVDLTRSVDSKVLKEELREYIDRPFYETCRHHAYEPGEEKLTAKAAEQGYKSFC